MALVSLQQTRNQLTMRGALQSGSGVVAVVVLTAALAAVVRCQTDNEADQKGEVVLVRAVGGETFRQWQIVEMQ